MKKKLIAFLLIFCLAFLCSCDKGKQLSVHNETVVAPNKGEYSSDGFNLLNYYETDVTKDGNDDIISLYINSEKDEKGELVKNDSNEWMLLVYDSSNNEHYTLFDEKIQVGDLYFQVVDYFDENEPSTKILLYKITGTEIEIASFKYVEKDKGFVTEKIYNTSDVSKDGINLRYSSFPHH